MTGIVRVALRACFLSLNVTFLWHIHEYPRTLYATPCLFIEQLMGTHSGHLCVLDADSVLLGASLRVQDFVWCAHFLVSFLDYGN